MLPEPRYYVPFENGQPPDGATLIGNEEFAELWESGELMLAGPEADREREERERLQDGIDLETIRKYEEEFMAAEPRARPVLREITKLAPNAVMTPSGDIELAIEQPGRPALKVLTHGMRARIREVADGIRRFGTKENQLAIYEDIYNLAPASAREKLQMRPVEEISLKTERDIRDIVRGIMADLQVIENDLAPVDFEYTPPVTCGTDEGAGSGFGDTWGNLQSCGFQSGGLMLNMGFPAKRHQSCVKDQAKRGTCSAFATVSAMESQVHRKYGRRVNLSEQALYARAKLIWGGGEHYGDGFRASTILKNAFWERTLIPWEYQWEYNPSNMRVDYGDHYDRSCWNYGSHCSEAVHQAVYVCTEVLERLGVCGYQMPDINSQRLGFRVAATHVTLWDSADPYESLDRIKLALRAGHEVILSYDVVTSTSDVDSNGYVTYYGGNEDTEGGAHIVHVVGYVDNADLRRLVPDAPLGTGGGYLIIKNSWSNCYGDGGYFYMPYASVRAYTFGAVRVPPVQ